LISAFVLIDIRHSPLPIDIEFINWLAQNSISFSIIFTKCDKLKPNVIQSNLEKYKLRLQEDWEILPNFFITSSSKFLGREEILDFISEVNLSLTKKST
jgi:GTP-binding protein